MLADLPPIRPGSTHDGKLSRNGVTDPEGKQIILPAEKFGPTRNVENPELYAAFPYRLYGVGKPDLRLARDTFAARLFPQDTCWGQDGPQAAVVGPHKHSERKQPLTSSRHYGDQRYPWFWKARARLYPRP